MSKETVPPEVKMLYNKFKKEASVVRNTEDEEVPFVKWQDYCIGFGREEITVDHNRLYEAETPAELMKLHDEFFKLNQKVWEWLEEVWAMDMADYVESRARGIKKQIKTYRKEREEKKLLKKMTKIQNV